MKMPNLGLDTVPIFKSSQMFNAFPTIKSRDSVQISSPHLLLGMRYLYYG